MPLKVAFLGSPEFSLPSLKLLHDAVEVALVISQPDKPKGRGKKLLPTPVKAYAEANGIPVITPKKLTGDSISEFQLDSFACVAYGQIIPPEIISRGVLNVHPSLLPRWRGAAPIERAIMSGDTETGVSIMRLDDGLDTGPVVAQERLSITSTETSGDLRHSLGKLGAELLLACLLKESLKEQEQATEGVTYAEKLNAEDLNLCWDLDAKQVHNTIRALDPTPGAKTKLNEKVFKLFSSRVSDTGILTSKEKTAQPGTIVCVSEGTSNAFIRIACSADTCIEVLEVQLEGKTRVSVKDFCNSQPGLLGKVLGD